MGLLANSIKAVGRLKDGDKWFTYVWSNAGVDTNRDYYIRYKDGLLMCEIDENIGQGRRLVTVPYLNNHQDLPFVLQSSALFATDAQMAAKGISANGPLNMAPSSVEIPYEITDATGKIAAKPLPTDPGEEVKKATEVVQRLALSAAPGGTTSTTAASTRNIIGWVALGLLGVGIVVGAIALVRYFSKKKK